MVIAILNASLKVRDVGNVSIGITGDDGGSFITNVEVGTVNILNIFFCTKYCTIYSTISLKLAVPTKIN
jgi:hypothetical protein